MPFETDGGGVSGEAWDLRENLVDEFDSDELFLVNPSVETVDTVVNVAFDEESQEFRILVEESVMKSSVNDFPFATKAADLVDQDRFEFGALEELPRNSMLLGDERVVVLVTDDDQVLGVTSTSDNLLTSLSESYMEYWGQSEPFKFRTPPLSIIRETLEQDFSDEFLGDFDAAFDSLETMQDEGEMIDEVSLFLLLAAKHGELLYDISKWGEDNGVASKATFSRSKTTLEDLGLIDTEKVPIDVGRPRLRLLLGHEDLEDVDGGELATVAQSLIT